MSSSERIQPVVDVLQAIGAALVDAYVLIDAAGTVAAYNRHFFDLFPKHLGRRLKQMRFTDLVRLELADEILDIAKEAVERRAAVRYDEVTGYFTDGPNLALIASAAPVLGPSEEGEELVIDGVLVFFRDMTDLAEVQTKYQRMLGAEAQDRARLERTIEEQGRRILTLGDELNRLRAELSAHRRGLLV